MLSLFSTLPLTNHSHTGSGRCKHSLCTIREHPRWSAPPSPPRSSHSTQARVNAQARGRAPPHTQQHPPYTHTPAQPGNPHTHPKAPSSQPRNTPGLPLARLRARTRTHALPASPQREGAQVSGGGEPRAESWVHPALGFRAEAPGWPSSPDPEQLALETIYASSSSRRPLYFPARHLPLPRTDPKSEPPVAARSGFPTPRPQQAGGLEAGFPRDSGLGSAISPSSWIPLALPVLKEDFLITSEHLLFTNFFERARWARFGRETFKQQHQTRQSIKGAFSNCSWVVGSPSGPGSQRSRGGRAQDRRGAPAGATSFPAAPSSLP